MKIPKIVIAGTNSGCGKTTIAMGILGALTNRGLKVQPFKVGPDYIDPMFHTFITSRKSRNLDSFMLSEDTLRYLFKKNSKDSDISIIEGVMGLYDGLKGTSLKASTSDVAKVINAAVILVVNGEGISLSIAAIIKGFMDFDRDTDIKGVIINNIKSTGHYTLLKKVIEENTNIKVLGYLLKNKDYSLESRHLGLIPSEEIQGLKEKISILSAEIEKTIDLDLLMEIGKQGDGSSASLEREAEEPSPCFLKRDVTIAVAMDKAFNFYYQDNIDLLNELGAKIIYFSPLKDNKLPEDIDGLYIGGGYPEIWAGELQNNTSMRSDIRKKVSEGLPAYAECGGLMYLTESITDIESNSFEMVGLIKGKSRMTSTLKRFGYIELESTKKTVLANTGDKIKAHEFHYSLIEDDNEDFCHRIIKSKDREWSCGYSMDNLLASYQHLHFWSNVEFAERFIVNCEKYKECRGGQNEI